jgi:hypothetical protein
LDKLVIDIGTQGGKIGLGCLFFVFVFTVVLFYFAKDLVFGLVEIGCDFLDKVIYVSLVVYLMDYFTVDDIVSVCKCMVYGVVCNTVFSLEVGSV